MERDYNTADSLWTRLSLFDSFYDMNKHADSFFIAKYIWI